MSDNLHPVERKETQQELEEYKELAETIQNNDVLPSMPVLRIKHGDAPDEHTFVMDRGGEKEKLGQEVFLRIFLFDNMRSLWEKGNTVPLCSAKDGIPLSIINAPQNDSCKLCKHGDFGSECKPIFRLIVELLSYDKKGKEISAEPAWFYLTPTARKQWTGNKGYASILKTRGEPYQFYVAQLTLEHQSNSSFTWAVPVFKPYLKLDIKAAKRMVKEIGDFKKAFEGGEIEESLKDKAYSSFHQEKNDFEVHEKKSHPNQDGLGGQGEIADDKQDNLPF